MRKIFLASSFFLCLVALHAQKKFFFESIKINSFLYTDDILYNKNQWAKQFKEPYHPSAQKFDSLNFYGYKDWVIRINGGEGVQIRLQKIVPAFASHSRNKLEWNTGLGFRTFRMKSEPLSYNTFPYDTTGIYFRESEQLQLTQSFIDIYNSAVYSHHSKFLKGAYGFIGIGFQTSFSISSKIKDTYYSGQQKWNTTQRKWDDVNINNDTSFVPAKNCFMYLWTIPIGLGMDVSKKISLEGAIEYYHARRSPALTEKKYSEGGMFQMIIRYKL